MPMLCVHAEPVDSVGNPRNDGTWTYTWEHGRQLASMTGNGATWTFDYDADGMRTRRASGLNAYNYVYNGGKLTRMTFGVNTLTFTYDAQGSPQTVNFNGTLYYYVTNLQGDVTEILDANGTAVVSYSYDAWGNHLSTTGTMSTTIGTRNPLRYRGYVYDHETGLYYLQSRYYNPTTGRFLNADALASTGQGELGNNMFAYCNNNPIMLVDGSGMAPFPTTVAINDGGKKNLEDVTDEEKKMYFLHALSNFVHNTSEAEVLAAEYLAFYKGVPVIKIPFMGTNAFSFGAIFMGSDVNKISTVRHEYGHALHFQQIGPTKYLYAVAIPSLAGFWGEPITGDYYSQPWEYIADLLGQVNRQSGGAPYQYSISELTAVIYWLLTLVA